MPKCPNCSNKVEIGLLDVAINRGIFSCRNCRSPLRLSPKSYLILVIPFVIFVLMPVYTLLQALLTDFFGIKIPTILDVDKSPLVPFFKSIFVIILNPIFLAIWLFLWWKKFAGFDLPDLIRPEVRPQFMAYMYIFFAVAVIILFFFIFNIK
jgi:hypothetical protein